MKEVIYGYWLQQSKDLLRLAQQRTAELEEVVRSFAHEISAEWDRGDHGEGRSVVTLRLWDFAGSATAVFDSKELESPTRMRVRINRLWGDLLQIRSHYQLRRLFR